MFQMNDKQALALPAAVTELTAGMEGSGHDGDWELKLSEGPGWSVNLSVVVEADDRPLRSGVLNVAGKFAEGQVG